MREPNEVGTPHLRSIMGVERRRRTVSPVLGQSTATVAPDSGNIVNV